MNNILKISLERKYKVILENGKLNFNSVKALSNYVYEKEILKNDN